MNKNTWVLVADEGIARILALASPGGDQLHSVEELTDALAHASGVDLRRDAVGRRASGKAPGARGAAHATASAGEGEAHDEAMQFARRVARHLDEALMQRRFQALQLVAAPRFLGLLRQALSPAVAGTVGLALAKDYVHLANDDLFALLYPDS